MPAATTAALTCIAVCQAQPCEDMHVCETYDTTLTHTCSLSAPPSLPPSQKRKSTSLIWTSFRWKIPAAKPASAFVAANMSAKERGRGESVEEMCTR